MPYNFSKVKVLVVESTIPMFQLFRDVMNMLSVPMGNIDSAYSAEEGYAQFKKGNHDLLLVDWLDNPDRGIHLTLQIRRLEDSPNRFVPIIMTAGSGNLLKVTKARDAGVTEYLVKPFTASQLSKRINRVIEKPRPFVLCDTFIGPDRRFWDMPFTGRDRRNQNIAINVPAVNK